MANSHERRKAARLRQEERAVIRGLSTGTDTARVTIYCSTIDLSPDGIQVRLSDSIDTDILVDIVIMLEGYAEPFELAGKVIWCTRLQDDNEHTVGIELSEQNARDIVAWRRIFN